MKMRLQSESRWAHNSSLHENNKKRSDHFLGWRICLVNRRPRLPPLPSCAPSLGTVDSAGWGICLAGLTWALGDIWQRPWSLLTRNQYPPPTCCNNQKCLQTLLPVLWGTESPLVENHCLRVLFTDCGEISSVITLTPPPAMSHIGGQATVVLRSHTYTQCALSLDVCFGPRRKGGCHSIIGLCLSLMIL